MDSHRNNFGTLRLLAALTVLVSHAVPITFGDNRHEILFRISHCPRPSACPISGKEVICPMGSTSGPTPSSNASA